ncbi:sulfur carrier protein ThiS [Dorea sp. OM02-2LB]|nr:sulfur carrier protein ThiS [Dorea sp. OM02-2LB]
MKVTVNGKEILMEEEKNVEQYLKECGYQMKRIAVELNGDILPKYQYSETMLKDGDSMEVVTFVGGG